MHNIAEAIFRRMRIIVVSAGNRSCRRFMGRKKKMKKKKKERIKMKLMMLLL